MPRNRSSRFMMGLLLGAAAGVLMAPKKGTETRERLYEKAMDLMTDSQEMRENLMRLFYAQEEPQEEIVIRRDFTDSQGQKTEQEIVLHMDSDAAAKGTESDAL